MAKQRAVPEVQAEELREINSLLELDMETTDPEFHYRWVREAPQKVGNAKIKGYVFVNVNEGVKTRAGFIDDAGDGLMRVSDVILMKCPVEKWRGRKRAQQKVANARMSAPAKQFKKNARRRRVRILREEDE
jgi:hypothetical protein